MIFSMKSEETNTCFPWLSKSTAHLQSLLPSSTDSEIIFSLLTNIQEIILFIENFYYECKILCPLKLLWNKLHEMEDISKDGVKRRRTGNDIWKNIGKDESVLALCWIRMTKVPVYPKNGKKLDYKIKVQMAEH